MERIVFRAPESHYGVVRFHLEGVGDQRTYESLTTLAGELGDVFEGELLRVGGEWETHPRHGRHFRVEWTEQRLPVTVPGIERFLGSGLIKGIGPGTAKLIVNTFGERTIEVIESHPEQLRTVKKLSRKRADLLLDGWHAQRQTRELMLFLRSHELPAHVGRKIREVYGDECVSVVQRDPYCLIREVAGIGFKTADEMARKLGLPETAPSRLVSGLRHVLDEATREGHVLLPKDVLLDRAGNLLGVGGPGLETALLDASTRGLVILDGDAVYPTPYFHAERKAAGRLQALLFARSFVEERNLPLDPVEGVTEAVKTLGVTLADRQVEAAVTALREKVSIITGGPGTGKTMCLHALITALDLAGVAYSLCAPTGRAAKRMTAATGRSASTIHRLLSYQPATNNFAHDAEHLLPEQFLIIDEVSMLDILLFHQLLRALPESSHLVLVGDSDQLPAVGAGNVLRDLLDSGVIPAVTLDELFRQATDSQITVAAHEIRHGRAPKPAPNGDLYVVRVDGAERARAVIEEMVAKRIPSRFGLDPKRDIQVLTPTHRGPAGVSALNDMLQQLLNPKAKSLEVVLSGSSRYRIGDKVMQTKNNYEKEVFNGDVGLIAAVDTDYQALTVRFGEGSDFRDVNYEFNDLSELVLAYAVSVHKSQGSEFSCVVMPLLTSHYPLLQRNLLYTAVTRARQLCVLVCQSKALHVAVSAARKDSRYTRLSQRLAEFRTEATFALDPAPLSSALS